MKTLYLLILLLIDPLANLNDIATINRLKQEAETAYQANDYEQAAAYYTRLVDSLQVDDEAVRLNLAHALLMAGDTARAQQNYSRLTASEDRSLKSVAYQQMGVVASDQKKYEEALAIFKESLKANPNNEEARYNYELVKKLLKQQQEQEQQNQDQEDESEGEEQNEQQQQDQSGEEQQDEQDQSGEESQDGEQSEDESSEQEGEQGEEQSEEPGEESSSESEEGEGNEQDQPMPPSVSDKLKEMNISEEKAQMILEAMRNNEMQYIQQNRRKPQKPRDRTKPDW